MTAIELLAELRNKSIDVLLHGDDLKVRWPLGTQSAELRESIKRLKRELVALLTGEDGTNPSPLFIDLETRSAADLRKIGGRKYASDPSTELLSVVALVDEAVILWFPTLTAAIDDIPWPEGPWAPMPVEVFVGPELPAQIQQAIDSGRPFVGHNCWEFDALVWAAQGLPEPTRWVDTLPMLRAAGVPRSLDSYGKRLHGLGKDKDGQEVMKWVSRPNKHGHFPPLSQANARLLARYNIVDVLLTRDAYERYRNYIEPEILAVDQAINSRGIAFDVELATSLVALSNEHDKRIQGSVASATGDKIRPGDLRKPKVVLNWLRQRDVSPADLQRSTLEHLLETRNLARDVQVVLRARIAAMRKGTSKLDAGLLQVDEDSRLRHLLVYHQAHTGRWAGRYVQPQNLPRPKKELGDLFAYLPHVGNLDELLKRLPAGCSFDDLISSLIRLCFRAKPGHVFCIADFAGIEARGVAWCAGQQDLLRQFADGEDVYCQLASKLFGREITKRDEHERAVGKVAILGCGYSMGVDRFAETCARAGVDLEAIGLSAEQVVEGYRDAYPAIAGTKVTSGDFSFRENGLWQRLGDAAKDALINSQPAVVAKCTFRAEDGALTIRLPSGRRMWFRDARIEGKVPGYAAKMGLASRPRPTVVYRNSRGIDEDLYGGRLTENVVSGICRDLQAAALVALEKAGLPVVLHVHDEIIIEVPEDRAEESLQRMLEIMSTPPAWAAGFPVQAEGFSSPRYSKSPPVGAKTIVARDGQILTS